MAGAFTLKGFESPEEVQARIGKVQQGALNTGGGFSGIEGAIYNAAAQGQAGIGKAIQTATGYEDPAVKKARFRQETMSGVDLTDRDSVGEAAKSAMQVDPELGMFLIKRHDAMKPVDKKAPKTIKAMRGADEVTMEYVDGKWRDLEIGQKPQSKTEVNINNQMEKSFNKALGLKEGAKFAERKDTAKNAVINISANMKAVSLLNQGMKTGFGANFMVGAGQLLRKAGINYSDNDEINSQAYGALLAKQTAEIIKAFGAGTGLSDADREFARKAAGGEITMDEEALRIIMKLNTIASITSIKDYNKDAAHVEKKSGIPYSLMVENPYSEEQMAGITGYDSNIGLTGSVDPKKVGKIKNKWLNLKVTD